MIRGYIGLLGMGKTISMVNDSIDALRKGQKVITNTPFAWRFERKFNKENPNYKVLNGKEYYVPTFIDNPTQFKKALFNETNCLICIDEASILLSSYDWQKMSLDFIMKFAQARKYGLDIFYTSQGFNHTVKRLRDLTNEVVACKKYMPFGFNFITNTTYDPDFFAQRVIANSTAENKYVLKRKTIYSGRLKKLYSAYDTMFKVGSNMLTDEEKAVHNLPSVDLTQFIK